MSIRAIVVILCLAASGCALTSHPMLDQYRQGLLEPARHGNVEAQYKLGMTYCCGFDPARSQVRFRHWLCRAALQGYAPAQYQLGRYYEEYTYFWRAFDATAQNIVQSYVWYGLAADQGDQMAAQYQATLGHLMSPSMRAEARGLRADWQGRMCSDVRPAAEGTL